MQSSALFFRISHLVMLLLGGYPYSEGLAQGMSTPAIRIEIASSFNPVGSGARALGMGSAFIAIADDATAASWNPGGLIQLRRPEIAAVGAFVYRSEDNTFGTHPEASGQEDVSNVNLNYLSASYPCKAEICGRNMVFSINYQHLFDFYRQWNFPLHQSVGPLTIDRLIDYRQEGDLYAIGLAYAIQATEQLALGITFNFWDDFLFDNEWTQTYRVLGTGLLGEVPFTIREFSRDRFSFSGFNMNLGLWWEAYQKEEQKLTIGVVLKTPFTADIKHEFSVKRFSTLPTDEPVFLRDVTDKQQLRMPLAYGLGIAYQFSDAFTLAGDIFRTEWDDFESRGRGGGRRSPISNLPIDQSQVDATYQVRLGAEYRLISKEFGRDYVIPLRAGLFYDPAPAEGNPDDFYGITVGAGVAFKTLVFDLAYQFRFGNNVGKSGLRELGFEQDVQEHTVHGSVFIRF